MIYVNLFSICFVVVVISTGTINHVKADYPGNYKIKDNTTSFDYIVVGAGAGGSAAASRLALAGHSVLLVEAGGNPTLLTKIPGLAQGLLESSVDWAYKTESNNVSCLSSIENQCRFSRGKCLGGSTSINYMLYVRGNRKDFDSWGVSGWTYEDMLPYFLRYENLHSLDELPSKSIPYHNTSGIMDIEFFADSQNKWHQRLFTGYNDLGIQNNSDCNSDTQIGVTQSVGYVYKNERMSTARAYLANENVLKVINLVRNAHCTKVVIDENNVAKGVIVKIDSKYYSISANKEVILSAGAVGTPQILLLSGVGPSKDLADLGIEVKADLPVGQGMVDHVLSLVIMQVRRGVNFLSTLNTFSMLSTHAVQWLLTKDGALASNGLTDVMTFLNTNCYNLTTRELESDTEECALPTTQMIHAYIDENLITDFPSIVKKSLGFKDDVFDQLREANKEGGLIVFSPVVLKPNSKGYIKLRSSSPDDTPLIYPNYLGEESDVEEIVRSIRIIEALANTTTFAENGAKVLQLSLDGCDAEAGSDEYWRCYTRHTTYSVYHSTSTAALGTVLDEKLRVKGISGLRVADLSAVPDIPRGNTEAITVAIGERVVDFIAEEIIN